MNHNPLSLFEKRQRHSGADNEARCAMDKENVLYDSHGKPVLDKDGHPVYVDRQLGQRPLLNEGEADMLGEIPPEEKREDEDRGPDSLPPEEKERVDAPDPDPLRQLLEEADSSSGAD